MCIKAEIYIYISNYFLYLGQKSETSSDIGRDDSLDEAIAVRGNYGRVDEAKEDG